MKKIAILLLLLNCISFAQVESATADNPFYQPPDFFYDMLNFFAPDTQSTRLDIYIQIPFSKIKFIKSGDNFRADYNVSVSVYDENRLKLITEKSWSEKVQLADFSLTSSKVNYNLSLKSFLLKPAKYVIRINIEDMESRKIFNSEGEILVRTFDQNVAVSDLIMVSGESQKSGNLKLIPNVSRNVASIKTGLPVYYEIYSASARNIKIDYKILDNKGNELYTDQTEQEIKAGNNQILYTYNFKDIGLGDYIMTVAVSSEDGSQRIITTKPFYSKWIGVPNTLKDLERAVDQMVYLATPSEIDYIHEGADYTQKLERFVDFWRKKDPTPQSTENELFTEYYRRVDYANRNFKQMLEGWRSDMGMVYITLGAPNNVERHPFEYNSKPYEVWEYYDINRRFTFVDITGFGDYRLINPFFGEYQYR